MQHLHNGGGGEGGAAYSHTVTDMGPTRDFLHRVFSPLFCLPLDIPTFQGINSVKYSNYPCSKLVDKITYGSKLTTIGVVLASK
jgi:hypothetical protein